MNSPGLTAAWLNVMVLLALETGLAALLTAAAARYCAGAAWRRTVYQAGILAILLLAAGELSGLGRELAGRLVRLAGIQKGQLEGEQDTLKRAHRALTNPYPLPQGEGETYDSHARDPSRSNLLPLPGGPGGEGRGEGDTPDTLKRAHHAELNYVAGPIPYDATSKVSAADPLRPFGTADGENVLASSWLWLVWAFGTFLVAGRACVGRCLFALFRSRRRPVTDQKILEQAQALSRKLGMKRQVRLVESARLKGPIAFGLVRPTIGLPVDFAERFDDASQSAILAHELAHLAAHDTFWHALADMAAALLWWHPAVWWTRRQLRLTSELAADEASLLVADGPSVLAKCLLELGVRLVQPPLLGELPVSGFRSHLGRRIQRLLNLQAKEWSAPGRARTVAFRLFGPLTTAIILVLSTAWVVPQAITKGNDMKTMQLNWKQSLATFALLGAMSGPEAAPTAALGGDQAAPATTPSAAVSHTIESSAGHSTFTSRLKRLDKRAQIENKLQEIVLPEVMFDGLPVSEVVKYLSQQAGRLDHDQQGINFLIDPKVVSAVVPGTVDPATGLPVAVPVQQMDVGSISIRFNLPLRHVTLKEALEAIVRVADHPIQYAVEDYGVVISARTSAEPALAETRPAPMAGEVINRLKTLRIEEEASLRREELLL
jgi:beta-lactamase regulating signal transducer with metallopeptidase domain